MTRRLPATLIVLTTLAISAPLAAQQVIDVFEDQNDMSSEKIEIDDENSSSSSESWNASSGGGFTMEYERRGGVVLVEAEIHGKQVYFIFDTGASYVTLPSSVARSLGVYPKKSYPRVMTQTANGPRPTQFGILRRLELGGRRHSGVTFTVCDACPGGVYKGKPVVGLLGMNILGRYETSLDEGRGVIKMSPGIDYANRRRDIEPWLAMRRLPAESDGGKPVPRLEVKNRAPRTIRDLEMSLDCTRGATGKAKLASLPAGASKKMKAHEVPEGCLFFKPSLSSARW